ncbi:hypothetical protein PMAYCL1PPCAC_32543, partial [Pristionchus mayeri]
LLLLIFVQATLAEVNTPTNPARSLTCSKCVSVIDSYRFRNHMIESVRRTRSELMGRCHRWSGGQITCRKVMSDQQNIRLLQASFMEPNNNPHLSCIAIKMCGPFDYDIYLRRNHDGEQFSYDLPPDFNDKLKDYYKKSLGVVDTNSTSVEIKAITNSSKNCVITLLFSFLVLFHMF